MSDQNPTDARRQRVRPGIYRRTNPGDGSTVYEITFRDSGGSQRRETVGARLKEAEARLAQVKADMSRGVIVAGRCPLTLAQAAEVWHASTAGQIRESTRAQYRNALDRHLLPSLGHRRMEALSPDEVARWARTAMTLRYARERGRTSPYSARMVRICLTTLGRVFGHAQRRQGYAGQNPVRALERGERPRDEERSERTTMTPEQVSALVAATGDGYRPVVAFIAQTGCRVSEALGLVWADLDLAKREVRFERQLGPNGQRAPLKTARSRRRVDLSATTVRDLAALKLASPDVRPHALVFRSKVGKPNRHNVNRALYVACERSGVPQVSAHDLRHAHGSALLAAGVDPATVAQRLGHSLAVLLSTYAHALDDEARAQQRRAVLDGLYGAAIGS